MAQYLQIQRMFQTLVLAIFENSNNNIIALHGPYSLQDDIDRTKYIYMKTGQGPKEDLSKLKIQALSLHLG